MPNALLSSTRETALSWLVAGQMEDGLAAYIADDHATAMWPLRMAADGGHAVAQLLLGFMFDRGRCVPKDYAQAANWYKLVADQNYAEAQFFLGLKCECGQGTPQDLVQKRTCGWTYPGPAASICLTWRTHSLSATTSSLPK